MTDEQRAALRAAIAEGRVFGFHLNDWIWERMDRVQT